MNGGNLGNTPVEGIWWSLFASQGSSGYSGASGYSGVSGYSGISGYSGVSGYSGIPASPFKMYYHDVADPIIANYLDFKPFVLPT